MAEGIITVTLRQQQDYQFNVEFGAEVPVLVCDEAAPLGKGQGPSPVQMLAASVGNCLSDSLLFALRKFKQSPEPLSCTVSAEVGRNAEGRMRVLRMRAELKVGVPGGQLQHLDRVLDQFESYCTVTQSVGQGISIAVNKIGRSEAAQVGRKTLNQLQSRHLGRRLVGRPKRLQMFKQCTKGLLGVGLAGGENRGRLQRCLGLNAGEVAVMREAVPTRAEFARERLAVALGHLCARRSAYMADGERRQERLPL